MEAEAEIKQLYEILKAILHNDNTIRAHAEVELKKFLVHPEKLLLYLVKLIQISQEEHIKKLSSVLFKHYLAIENASEMWSKITPEQQTLIKAELLSALQKELNPKVGRQICQAIAELASIIFDDEKEWLELDQLIVLYVGSNDFMVETAFRILNILFALNSDRYMKNVPFLCSLFDNAFARTSTNAIAQVSMALSTLICEIDTVQIKPFLKYSPIIIKAVQAIFNEKNEDLLHEMLESICEVTESEPTFFRKSFAILSEVLLKFSAKKDYENDKLRQMPLEMLVSIIERLPNIVKKNKVQLWNLCSALFEIMVSIELEVDSEWLRPKEGYNIEEDLNPDDNVNFGIICYDRLLASLDDEDIFPVMEKILEVSLASEDWRYRNAGLMSIAQIGEYAQDTGKVKNIMPIIIKHLSHTHPKVRFAALYCIGLLSDDLAPEFQEEFYKDLIAPLVGSMDDSVPRVQSQSCAALTNLLEHVTQSVAVEAAALLLPKLIKLIREGISVTKQNAITCISSIAESAADLFLPYYKELVPFLFECIKGLPAKEYNEFRGQSIECLTMISAAVGKEHFREHAPAVIELMNNLQQIDLSKGDPQRFYLLGAWERICLILEKEFVPYLPKIIPGILKIAGSMPEMGVSSHPVGSLESILKEVSGSTKSRIELSTSEIEEKDMALQMLQVFAVQLEEAFAPYVEETSRIVEPILTFKANSDIRRYSANILPNLLKCLKKAAIPAEKLITVARAYIAGLLNAHDKEVDANIKGNHIVALKDIFETVGHFMTAEDTNTFLKKIFDFFKDSNDRKSALVSSKKALDEDEDEDKDKEEAIEGEGEHEDSIELEEDYQKTLTYLLGAIFDTHIDESLPHIPGIIANLVQPYLSGNVNMQKIAIFILDDLAEYVGYAKLGADLWKQIAAIILTYTVRNEPDLRQPACYGIGCLAKSGGEGFKEISIKCLSLLASAIEFKEDKKHKDECAEARDNAIASIGKILKYAPTTIPFGEVWAKWLSLLPIKQDKMEAKIAHEFVVDTLIANPDVAVGVDGVLLSEIIRIFVGVYEKKLVHKTAKAKIIQAMKQMSAHSKVVAMLEDIYKNKLKPEDQAVMQKIINEAK